MAKFIRTLYGTAINVDLIHSIAIRDCGAEKPVYAVVAYTSKSSTYNYMLAKAESKDDAVAELNQLVDFINDTSGKKWGSGVING